MVTIQQILNEKDGNILTVESSTTAYKALEVMAEHNVGALPIVDGGRLQGVFSERDYARKVVLKGKSVHDTAVGDLMTRDVYTVRPEDTVDGCMTLMTDKHVRHLPVIDGGNLIGLVSIGDVVKTIIAEQHGQIQELHDYVSGHTY